MRFGGGGDEVKTNISGSSIDTALDLRPHHFVFLVVIGSLLCWFYYVFFFNRN